MNKDKQQATRNKDQRWDDQIGPFGIVLILVGSALACLVLYAGIIGLSYIANSL